MTTADFIKRGIAYNKTIVERGYSYFGIPGMGLVIASVMQRHLPWPVPLYYLFPLGMLCVWVVGLIDIKAKLYAEEASYKTRHNPISKRMYEILEKGEGRSTRRSR